MCNGTIMDKLISFSIPLMLSGILQLMFNAVDIVVVGRFSGSEALAAVGSTTALINVFTNLFIGISLGANVLAARFYAAGKDEEMSETVHTSILLALVSGVIMAFLGVLFARICLELMDTPDDVIDLSTLYMRIYFLGMPFFMLYNYGAAILRAVGDTTAPLLFLLFAAALNVALDLLFILKFGFGVAGAAWATVLSQSLSAIISLVYMFKRYPVFRFKPDDFKLKLREIKALYTSGLSMAAMMSLVFFGTLSLQCAINTFGQDIIVAHTAARKITEFFMLPFSVMGVTMASYCGQNMGAGRKDRIRTGICQALILTWIWSLGMILLSYTVAPWLIWLVTGSKNPAVLSNATWYLKTDTLFYFAPAAISILRNGLQGMGDHITPVFSSMIELIGKVICAFLLARIFQYWGIIMAEPIVWILMVIPLIIKARKLL